MAILLEEGQPAVDDAISFVKEQKTIPKFEKDYHLESLAQSHARYLGKMGIVSHIGENHEDLNTRIKSISEKQYVKASEIMEIGGKDPMEIFLSLFVEDGNLKRAHRRSLLNPCYTNIGISTSYHKEYESITVIILAT